MKVTHIRPHRSSTVIRVNIRSTTNKSTDHQNGVHIIQSKTHHQRKKTKKRQNENTSSSTNVTKIDQQHEDTVNKSPRRIRTKDAWLEQTGNTKDYHRNVKKKKHCNRYVKILVIATVAVLTIIITAILLVFLIKTKPETTTNSTITLRWNKTGITVAGVGIAGNGSDHLNKPLDVTLDSQNYLYIADTNNHRIQKYLLGASYGTTVAGNSSGIMGTSLNDLKYPSQVIRNSNGEMFVTDTYNHRILKYSNGSPAGIVVAGTTGILNYSNNTLNTPYRMDYHSASNSLYIADYFNSRIIHYLSGASSGFSVAGDNGIGKNTTQLYYPVGVYFESLSNSLIIANHFSNNIVRWTIGTTSWTLIAGDFDGNNGSNATMLTRPTDITFDPMNNMYIVDRNNQRIQLFMNGQTEGITIAGVTGIVGNNSTLFNQPWSVELDNQLNLYVADSNNHRIQKFVRY